ncbi:hypothetical protein [Phaeovulum sp.]|jgi:hypothetical protein|uniref:hypothetical protein n=1 Tax=Phaeovulum sp. TaxID=2934796 RepID=UPI002730AF34|nr:hypothetical protein [Phaeovulum sp.]MDP1669295.1 hypothetical protein [Phaeovulum sp.]MDP2063514.1 hypothetical protein [Phaeovulum sp.]MDP3862425.1 hypothetical protein [Phaeovulum sp.]MDZ4119571.1 hypothetical protein [Phaeovulum sp.]
MPEIKRDRVQDYRPGPASELPLEPGERLIAVFVADRRRYWLDHAAMAALGAAGVVAILPFFDRAGQIPIALPAVAAAVAARGLYLASEAFSRRWQLTDRRLIGPQGRQVMLLEIAALRRMMGDVQIVTKGGAKHLIKHLADSGATIATIERARDARAKVKP